MALYIELPDTRPAVASNLSISEKEFDRRFAVLFPALVARALRALGPKGDDVPTEVYLEARTAWQGGRYVDLTAETGQSLFARWVNRIFEDAVRRTRIEAPRPGESLESLSAAQAEALELWWGQLSCETNRNAINDAELRSEAIQRLKQAILTDEERLCIHARVWGQTLAEIQQTLVDKGFYPLSLMTICRRIESAVLKMRAVPAEMLTPPDVDGYEWRIANDLTIYHAPLTTGSALARERMALSEAQYQKMGLSR